MNSNTQIKLNNPLQIPNCNFRCAGEQSTGFFALVFLTASVALPLILTSATDINHTALMQPYASLEFDAFTPEKANNSEIYNQISSPSNSQAESDAKFDKREVTAIDLAHKAVLEIKQMSPEEVIQSVEDIRNHAELSNLPKSETAELFRRPFTKKELEARKELQHLFESLSKEELQIHFERFFLRKHMIQEGIFFDDRQSHATANNWIIDEVRKSILRKGGKPRVPSMPSSIEKKEGTLMATRDAWEIVLLDSVTKMFKEEFELSSKKFSNFREKKKILQDAFSTKMGPDMEFALKTSLEQLSTYDLILHREYFNKKVKEIMEIIKSGEFNENEQIPHLISAEWIVKVLYEEIKRREPDVLKNSIEKA